MTSIQFHRDNHFVPCVYLKGWAGPDGKIATYRVLVPHDKFPTWRRYSPSALAYHSHLYTQTTSGVEKDDIETWLDQDFERPAEEPLRKARTGARMSPDDWKQLIRFVAAQDVRTPAYYWEQAKRVDEKFPNLMQSTIETAIKEREQSAKKGQPANLKSLPGRSTRLNYLLLESNGTLPSTSTSSALAPIAEPNLNPPLTRT
jgi:hypothetical protein